MESSSRAQNLLPSKRKLGEDEEDTEIRLASEPHGSSSQMENPSPFERRARASSDRILQSKARDKTGQNTTPVNRDLQNSGKKGDEDCFLSFVHAVQDIPAVGPVQQEDKENSVPITNPKEPTGHNQCGDATTSSTTMLVEVAPPASVSDTNGKSLSLDRDNDPQLSIPSQYSHRKGPLDKILVAANVELRQKNGQYEQLLVEQASQLDELQRQLENQALEHSKILKEKDAEMKQDIITLLKEKQEQMIQLRTEKEAALLAVENELKAARSANYDEMSSKILALGEKEKSYATANSTLKTEISLLRKVNEQVNRTLATNHRGHEAKLAELQRQLKVAQSNTASLHIENSQLRDYCNRSWRLSAEQEGKMKALNQRLENAKAAENDFRQKLEDARTNHESSIENIRTMWQNALREQQSLSSDNQQLRCNQQTQQERIASLETQNQHLRDDKESYQNRISDLETRLEQMEEEMSQMQMNHAMELGFNNVV